jgi:tetratricopeptide (TPR) repeat protein
MNAPTMHAMMNCPTDETLAAFVDGKLDEKARLEVIEHLTECADCRDIVLMATEEAAANNVVPMRRPRWLPYAAAAAAVLVLMFAVPTIWEYFAGAALRNVRNAAASMPQRPSDARLSFDLPYQPATRIVRGGDSPEAHDITDGEITAMRAVADAEQRAEKHPTAANLRAVGIASMLHGDHQRAAEALKAAVDQGNPSAALLNDLAAAYLFRGSKGDYERALEEAERSWRMEPTPAAAWNRALALERLYRTPQANTAWQEYLKIDPNSDWAKEVREEHLTQ